MTFARRLYYAQGYETFAAANGAALDIAPYWHQVFTQDLHDTMFANTMRAAHLMPVGEVFNSYSPQLRQPRYHAGENGVHMDEQDHALADWRLEQSGGRVNSHISVWQRFTTALGGLHHG
ncbi:hypothetical protein GC177_06475 [bacterium]|nr:hypothetical protein [bacterium]